MVIFQYNIYIFVQIQHGRLTNTVYAMDPHKSVIKRLWCIYAYYTFDIIWKDVFGLMFYSKWNQSTDSTGGSIVSEYWLGKWSWTGT